MNAPRPSAGDIWLVDFGDPYPGEASGLRPAVIVAVPRNAVFLVPCTTTYRDLPSHIEIDAGPATASGLREPSYAQCEQLRHVAAARLNRRLGAAEPVEFKAVKEAIAFLLGL